MFDFYIAVINLLNILFIATFLYFIIVSIFQCILVCNLSAEED